MRRKENEERGERCTGHDATPDVDADLRAVPRRYEELHRYLYKSVSMYPRLPEKLLATSYGPNSPRGPNPAFRGIEGYDQTYAGLGTAAAPEGNVESGNDYWAAQTPRPGTSMGSYGKDVNEHWKQCQDAYTPPALRPGSAPVRLGAGTPPVGAKTNLFPRNLLQIIRCAAPPLARRPCDYRKLAHPALLHPLYPHLHPSPFRPASTHSPVRTLPYPLSRTHCPIPTVPHGQLAHPHRIALREV